MPESLSAATDLDLISYLKAIPDARMRRGVRIPAWHLLLVAVLGIMSGCQCLRDLERFAIRPHSVLNEALGIELRRSITWMLRAKQAPAHIREAWSGTSWIVELAATGTRDGKPFCATHL